MYKNMRRLLKRKFIYKNFIYYIFFNKLCIKLNQHKYYLALYYFILYILFNNYFTFYIFILMLMYQVLHSILRYLNSENIFDLIF